MGFKCSVLGHRFDEPGLVHEREPRGDEVITIRRKVIVCTLCGEQRVLAENKEITKDINENCDETSDTDDTIDDSTVDDDNSDSTQERENTDDTTDDTIDETRDGMIDETNESGGVEINETNDETGKSDDNGVGERRGNGASVADEPTSEESGIGGIDVIHEQDDGDDSIETSMNAQQDDGVVLSDNGGGRGYGEWPDDANEAETDDRWEPEVLRGSSVSADIGKNDPTGPSTIDTETDTGVIISDKGTDGKMEGTDGKMRAKEETGTKEETRAEEETDEHTVESFYCPSCGFTVAAPDSPYRSGDSCPKCREEYLSINDDV